MTTGGFNITLRKFNINRCDNIYMDKVLIEHKFYQLTGQLNKGKNNHSNFHSVLLNNIHSF